MSYICIVAALEQIGQFVFLLKKSIFEAFQVSKSLMCTAHDNQYTSADELSNLHTVYQNRDTLFWTLAYKTNYTTRNIFLFESQCLIIVRTTIYNTSRYQLNDSLENERGNYH